MTPGARIPVQPPADHRLPFEEREINRAVVVWYLKHPWTRGNPEGTRNVLYARPADQLTAEERLWILLDNRLGSDLTTKPDPAGETLTSSPSADDAGATSGPYPTRHERGRRALASLYGWFATRGELEARDALFFAAANLFTPRWAWCEFGSEGAGLFEVGPDHDVLRASGTCKDIAELARRLNEGGAR